jgi:hypothetical protein
LKDKMMVIFFEGSSDEGHRFPPENNLLGEFSDVASTSARVDENRSKLLDDFVRKFFMISSKHQSLEIVSNCSFIISPP